MIAAGAKGPASRTLRFRGPLELCQFVDDLPQDEAGEIVFAEPEAAARGVVFVENGRVCWAAARGLARRLSDLLAASARLPASEMEELYGACKRMHAPLGEYLVDTGVVSADDLRVALLRHTAESLLVLAGGEALGAWVPRYGGGYSPRFTFTTTELFARALGDQQGTLAAEAARELSTAFEVGEWGAAYVRGAARATPDPIAVSACAPDKIESVLRLGRWASSTLDVAASLDEGAAFVATAQGRLTLVAWRWSGLTVAGCMGSSGAARLLNRRARQRRTGGPDGRL